MNCPNCDAAVSATGDTRCEYCGAAFGTPEFDWLVSVHPLEGMSAATGGERYRRLCRRWGLKPHETAAIGDDEPDVPMLEAAGFSACPADSSPEALKAAKLVLKRPGGRGAVREFVERVLAMNARRG